MRALGALCIRVILHGTGGREVCAHVENTKIQCTLTNNVLYSQAREEG